jgi:hypothetical protein
MVAEVTQVIVELDPESELAKVLAASAKKPIILVSNGDRYMVNRADDDLSKGNDDEEFREALRKVVGTLTPEEGERLKRDIYRWREEGSRPIDRP